MLFLFLLAGLTAGFFAGMFGIGGGAIVIPILVHVYRDAGMDMTEAIRLAFGTSLATMAFTGLSSYLSHRQRGNVDGAWLRKLMLPSGSARWWAASSRPASRAGGSRSGWR